jgi:hypothetical protein
MAKASGELRHGSVRTFGSHEIRMHFCIIPGFPWNDAVFRRKVEGKQFLRYALAGAFSGSWRQAWAGSDRGG